MISQCKEIKARVCLKFACDLDAIVCHSNQTFDIFKRDISHRCDCFQCGESYQVKIDVI